MSSSASTLLSVGATGSIGRYVVDEALRQGYAVRALVRNPDKARELPHQVEVVVGDLTHPDSLAPAVGGINMPLNNEPQRLIADLKDIRARSQTAAV